MKNKVQYSCTNCKFISIKWIGCCPQCNEWNSFAEDHSHAQTPIAKSRFSGKAPDARLTPLTAIKLPEQIRMRSSIEEWDRVLGGGILPGSFLVVTGDPGVGKSTLLLQIAHALSKKHSILYFSSEESLHQVKHRAERLKCTNDALLFSDQTSLETIITTAKEIKPEIMIIDSIQNCHFDSTTAIPGTIAQLREAGFHLMKLAKENKIAIIVTCHITKEGHMAGPKLLEHMVDGVFYLQGDEQWNNRILRSVKNRFGAINEIGFFEMYEHGLRAVVDINKTLLQESSNAPGAALIPSFEGSRTLFIELQALCIPSKFGMPQRVISGIDPKQVLLIAAILEKYLKVRFSTHDIFFKTSGNFKIRQSSIDLGIALALLSSYFQKQLPEKALAFGEISLTGQIKASQSVTRCIDEAEQFGITKLFSARSQGTVQSPIATTFKHVYELLSLFPE